MFQQREFWNDNDVYAAVAKRKEIRKALMDEYGVSSTAQLLELDRVEFLEFEGELCKRYKASYVDFTKTKESSAIDAPSKVCKIGGLATQMWINLGESK